MRNQNTTISGMNIYSDIYGKPVYYNFLDKKGYIIPDIIESKFKLIQSRYSIITILLILFNDYFGSVTNTILIGVSIMIIAEVYFRTIFLKKLKTVRDIKTLKKISVIDNIAKNSDKQKTIMKSIAYMFFGVLIILNAIQENFQILLLILSGVVTIVSFYFGVMNLIAVKRMKVK